MAPMPADHAARPASPTVGLAAAGTMMWREVVRFFRQRNRVIGAVATPLVFWVMLGLGLNETFRVTGAGAASAGASGGGSGSASGGMGYLAFFFPGMVLLMVLFTAIFSTISVIEDRREGFLQGVLASPAARWSIVLGKVLGGALIATVQGLVLLAAWCVFFAWPGLGPTVLAVVVLFVIAVGLTGLGLLIAWPMDSTAGFHAVMNLLLMPMWFLSGAVFPVETAGPLRWVMYANPLTYGQAAFAHTLQGDAAPGLAVSPGVAGAIMFITAAAALAGATRVAARPGR